MQCDLEHMDSVPSISLHNPAGDPEIEILKYDDGARKNKTPLAAWVLVNILLIFVIKRHSENVAGEISHLFLESTLKGKRRTRPYSKQIMIFCLTLAGYSTKAYEFLRGVVNKCLPSTGTLRTYRRRVDGSPGFSVAALNMMKRKANEMKDLSKNLYVSLSCDDMSIRYIFYVTKLYCTNYADHK